MQHRADQLIGSALRGQRPAPSAFADIPDELLIERVKVHGVAPLLHRAGFQWPQGVGGAIREIAHSQALWESAHHATLCDALRVLEEHGITPLLLKGSSLAYSLYDEPWLRTRSDSDLLVPQQSRLAVAEALESAGFERVSAAGGELASYQSSWQRPAHVGMQFLDVHWRINNSQVLADLFDYEELRARARPLPLLAPGAQGIDPVDALLIACMHRLTHKHNPYRVGEVEHHDPDRLIWLFDIHLLGRSFGRADWATLCERALLKGLSSVCLDGLQKAKLHFHSAVPETVLQSLAGAGDSEAPWRYLDGGTARQLWMDWRALRTGRRRAQWLRESLMPSAGYMRWRFPDAPHQSLAWLYLKRIVGGAYRRVTRRSAN